jgi:two-component SAPR family response regulator
MNWRQGVIASLCQRALEEGIETEYVKKLIRVRKLMPDEPPVHIEDWPWPVKIYTLGEFNILSNDEPLRFSGKAQKKPLEMLKMLLARRGSDASVELLCDDLWPEANGDLANVSFKTNLHRLRKLLGNDEAVILKDGRLSLNPRCCWFDVWAMERTMSQADELWDNGDKKKATLSFKYALELHNGHFLQSVGNAPWAMAAREKIGNRCLRAIGNIGSYHAENGDHRPAVKWYQRGLELDELREDFARNLMLCLNSLGRKGEATRAYERIRESLDSVLGVEPSSETTEVYESIIR